MSQKYDRDAFAFNHYIGFLRQPLKRHLSSDISYLVPSMQLPVVQISSSDQTPQTAMNYNTNNTPSPLNSSNDRPPLAVRYETSNTRSNQEPIYSAPRRQRSFRKQRSLDNQTNEGQLISTPGPNESNNQSGSLSVASSSVPHLPMTTQLQIHQQPETPAYTLKPISASTEGLIQHIISQQSQIERLSKQQDFLTQQLLLSRDTSQDAKRRGHSRARSRSTSSKNTHGGSSTSLEQVKHRSSSREKIQEQLHAQQARVQQHIQQLEAQLELIRDIRTSSRPSSRSHSREASVRSSCPPDDKNYSRRPYSADPKWLDSIPSQSDQTASSKKSTNVSNKFSTQSKARDEHQPDDFKDIQQPEQSLNKPRLILTNPSEESKDDLDENRVSDNSNTGLVVNRPTLLDQDDGIPFMDEELNDERDDGADESDELETVFEFERSKSPKGGYNEERNGAYKCEEDDEYEDWEDDEIDFYSHDVGESPEAESDPWAQLMEEDIMRARTEMDNQRSLMERQEMELAEQRQQILINSNPARQQLSAPSPITVNKMNSKSIANQNLVEQSRVSQQSNQFNVTGETFLRPNVNLIPSPVSPPRSPSPIPFSMRNETKQQPKLDSRHNYQAQFEAKQTQGNIFNFDQASIQSFQPTVHVSNQQHRLSPNYTQPGMTKVDPQINRSRSPVPENLNSLEYNYNVPPKIIDRQISTPVPYNHQSTGKPISSPDSNYLKRPSLENQPTDLMAQSSILRSKMIQPSASLASSSKNIKPKINQHNLMQTANLKQPAAPPRRKPVTPRSQSPIFGSSNASPSYRIQTNKNRMADQMLSQPKRPQRAHPMDQPFNQSTFNHQTNSTNLDGRYSPRVYSPKTMQLTDNRSDTVFRPISTKSQPKPTPMIRIDPAQSRSNLNLSSSFTNLARRSPSPQPQTVKKPFGSSFIQRIMGNSEKPEKPPKLEKFEQQQTLSPIDRPMSPSGHTLKIDMQTIRSNRSRASSPAPPNKEKSPVPKPARKIFNNKETVEAGSFVDHFNHYYAPNTEKPRRPLSQQFTNISTGDLNRMGRSVTPNRDVNSKMDSEGRLRRSGSSIRKPNNQSTANALIDAPIHFERRQTLPEITAGLGIADSTAKEEAILRNMAGKKKHSLPQDDLHEVPMLPGWEREKVATLAHEAREARMNQPTGPAVHLAAATNWLVKYKFTGRTKTELKAILSKV
uniref:Uncharacterized protein n=1 Tax=Tetranychus urticae TaxID=32264 RepID=T1K630_TETUR